MKDHENNARTDRGSESSSPFHRYIGICQWRMTIRRCWKEREREIRSNKTDLLQDLVGNVNLQKPVNLTADDIRENNLERFQIFLSKGPFFQLFSLGSLS